MKNIMETIEKASGSNVFKNWTSVSALNFILNLAFLAYIKTKHRRKRS